ncbi:MAG: hypothetical protein U0894_11750 [Pirellulales bacterium]
MTGFLEYAAPSFLFVAFLAFCMLAGAIRKGAQVYAEGIQEVLEERKHQRQIELMEMTLKLEGLQHGTVTYSSGTDSDRAWDRMAARETPALPAPEED